MNGERRRSVKERRVEERGQWASKTEYILVVAGNVVGLGNVWRFPYLCYKNGGGAFLVPYGALAVVCGMPLFLLESVIGVGCGHLLIKLYDSIYILIQAWALLYLIFSFKTQLPWASCDNTWNTDNCVAPHSSNPTENWTMLTNTTSAATEFWERRVLSVSGGIEELGSVRWELALCLMACWAFCYFSIWKGVRSSGKVVYFTATFSYVMILILLVRGLTLPGAWEGITFYLYPDLVRLADPELNSGTSFVVGFVVFSVLGFMAQKQGVPVDMVVDSGPGLAFIAYPQATAMMPLPQFWTVSFFLMLLLLGVDTHFVIVECFITSVSDLFPTLIRKPGRREIFVLVICLFFALTQLTLVSEGGIYIFQLIDYYGCNRAPLDFMAFFQCLAVGWIFGADRFSDIIEEMTGQRPCIFFKLCWRYFTPLLTLSSFILYLVNYKQLRVNRWYMYPDWAYALGWAMALSSIIMVPIWGIGKMYSGTGTLRQRLSILCRPVEDLTWQQRRTGELQTCVETETTLQ